MKESFWGYFIIICGLVGIAIVFLFQDVTNTNDQNYYLTKEITEAAMLDAVDIAHYRLTGEVAINKDKFTENFFRRYAESSSLNKTYDVKIFDIVEYPPKVSLTVNSKSTVFSFTGDDFNITNRIDGILESK